MIGKTLGHYRIVEKLGAGAMVYRAHDERLDRDAAVKILPFGATLLALRKGGDPGLPLLRRARLLEPELNINR